MGVQREVLKIQRAKEGGACSLTVEDVLLCVNPDSGQLTKDFGHLVALEIVDENVGKPQFLQVSTGDRLPLLLGSELWPEDQSRFLPFNIEIHGEGDAGAPVIYFGDLLQVKSHADFVIGFSRKLEL